MPLTCDQQAEVPCHYRHSGVLISSDIDLPAWSGFSVAAAGDGPDVQIRLRPAAAPDPALFTTTVNDGGVLRFSVEGVGQWHVTTLGMEIFPAPAADAAELAVFTQGSAWGALGYCRGYTMWHGSAVQNGSRTALICGEAGMGKSTLAATMVAKGGHLVSDDLSRIDADGALIYPSSHRLKLWDDAVAHLLWKDRIVARDLMREDKYLCAATEQSIGHDPVSLTDIVVLQTGGSKALLERLTGAGAMEAVLQSTLYRPEMIEALGAWPQQGAMAAKITSQCRVHRLIQPRDLGQIGHSAALVLEQLENKE